MTLFSRNLLIILVLSVPFGSVYAQLCQGSLGDPLVNITFGAGSNPGPSLTAATTAYQYVSNDCPNDGFYTVRSNTANCFNSSWHNFNSDHTGDPNGYFMLVNASIQPSAFYLDTVKGLCGGTTYEFAAWVMNVLRSTTCGGGIQPDLSFSIEKTDGTVLQSYNTNNIPNQGTPTWQQFGFFFATPVGVSDIVLRISNKAAGGCGNDLALDDITFRPCGPLLTSSIAGYTTSSVTVCEGTAQSFTFNCMVSAGFNNPSFQWQQSLNGGTWSDIPGATTTTFNQNFPSNTSPGIYSYRLSAAEAGNMGAAKCRVVSRALTITIATNPVTAVISNSPVCENNTISFTATGGDLYQWTGVNGFSASGATVTVTNAQSIHAGKYYVVVTNAAGCMHLDSVTASINVNPVAATTISEITICEGNNIQLVSSGGDTYKWIPATGLSSAVIANPVALPADTVNYSVIVINQYACSDTADVLVNVVEKPRANAGPDKMIIKGNPVQLTANASGQNISYTWSPNIYIDNILSLQPVITPPHDTSYILTVVSNEGCGTATDTMHVYVYKDVYVPTAFSPNGDGLNDTWYVPALSAYPEFTISLYNRYGEMIFQTKDVNKPWDGRYKGVSQAIGAYVYVIDLKQGGSLLKGTLMIVK